MIGVRAELERSLISERTRAGALKFGRKPVFTREQIAHARKLIDNGEDASLADPLVGRSMLYRALTG
jgi:DNA invertase Pin-like site-specific DNA recombinase